MIKKKGLSLKLTNHKNNESDIKNKFYFTGPQKFTRILTVFGIQNQILEKDEDYSLLLRRVMKLDILTPYTGFKCINLFIKYNRRRRQEIQTISKRRKG